MRVKHLIATAFACGCACSALPAMAGSLVEIDGVSQANPTNKPTVTGTTITITFTPPGSTFTANAYDVKPFGPPFNYASGRAGINFPRAGTGAGTQTATANVSFFPNNLHLDYYMTGLAVESNTVLFPSSGADKNRNMSWVVQDAVSGKYYGFTGSSVNLTGVTVGTHQVCRFICFTFTGPNPSPVKTDGIIRTAMQFYTDPSSTLNPDGTNSWSDIFLFDPCVGSQSPAGGNINVNLVPIDSLFNFNPGGQ